jgi:hypothetical protein
VHRDLKPANVKLTADDEVKVLDFGLARQDEGGPSSPADSAAPTSLSPAGMTRAGVVLGTAAYMSPEQTRGLPVDKRTDIWAFGCILYRMLAGRPAFAGETVPDTMAAILSAEVDMAALPSHVPRHVRRLVARCLERSTKARLRDIADARPDLEDDAPAGAPPPPAGASISRRAALAGAGALVLGGAGVGALGSSFAARGGGGPAATPSFKRVTFRRGMIRTARFGPDFTTILYGALWDGDVCRVYSVRPDSPESSPLPLPPAAPLAVSVSGELALALGDLSRETMPYGTLARVPLAGGAPREVEEQVKYADWSPDGRELVIVRGVGDRDQLELPPGRVLATPESPSGGWSFPRVSPLGDAVAAFELNSPTSLMGRLVVLDRSGRRRLASTKYFNLFGLAWNGDEVWFTGAEEVPLFRNTVYAMSPSGKARVVARIPGNASLHDVSPDGRVLLARTDDRSGIAVRAPDQAERDLSWLDSPWIAGISADGRRILFSEAGVGGGPLSSAYLRGTDGSPAVRLSDGFARALSPDGRWAVVQTGSNPPRFEVVPTGPGSSSPLERPGLALAEIRWLRDGRSLVVRAEPSDGAHRLYVLEAFGGATRPVTPEGLAVGDRWAASPDGSTVALSTPRGVELLPLVGGSGRRVPASERWQVVGWIETGLLVSEDPSALGTVYRMDPATGRRSDWAVIRPRDPAGIMNLHVGSLVVTPDGRGYGYSWHRAISDLYLVDGWS